MKAPRPIHHRFRAGLAAAALCACAAGTCLAQARDPAAPPAAASAPGPSPQAKAAPAGRIYQQRQKDGSILFTDRPPQEGAVTERSWAVAEEPPEAAEKRRERARQDAREEAQAVNERVQRQIDRDRDRETALALERMRLAQDQAQRDAEIARAERERSLYGNGAPPVVVVVPGGGVPPPRARQPSPPYGGIARPPPPETRPTPVRPGPALCLGKKASDCNPSDPARAGFGGR